jgi:hypothetical protein
MDYLRRMNPSHSTAILLTLLTAGVAQAADLDHSVTWLSAADRPLEILDSPQRLPRYLAWVNYAAPAVIVYAEAELPAPIGSGNPGEEIHAVGRSGFLVTDAKFLRRHAGAFGDDTVGLFVGARLKEGSFDFSYDPENTPMLGMPSRIDARYELGSDERSFALTPPRKSYREDQGLSVTLTHRARHWALQDLERFLHRHPDGAGQVIPVTGDAISRMEAQVSVLDEYDGSGSIGNIPEAEAATVGRTLGRVALEAVALPAFGGALLWCKITHQQCDWLGHW